jgi:hypothetical protein
VKLVLGIEVDCDNLMLCSGAEKLKDTQKLLLLWPKDRKLATLTELRSLAGKLLNIFKVVPQSRPFISRILEKICCPQGSCGSEVVSLDEALQKDILWWKQFLSSCNGIKMIRSLDCGPTDSNLSMDASPEGAGVVFLSAGVFLHSPFPEALKDQLRNSAGAPCMNSLELMMMLMVLCAWSCKMVGRFFAFWTDNSATVEPLNSGQLRAKFGQQVFRENAMITAWSDIHIRRGVFEL